MPVDATFAAIQSKVKTLVSYTANTISFSGNTIADSAGGFKFPANQRIKITGSAHNDTSVDGGYFVSAANGNVLTTEESLVAEAAGANITITWGPEIAYTDPRDAVNLGNFPCIVSALAPNIENTLRITAEPDPQIDESGLLRDEYTVALFVFLGNRTQPLNEVHAKAKPWAQAIAKVLAKDLTLGLNGTFLDVRDAGGGDPILFRYKVGAIAWSDGIYFGVTLLLPVVERLVP